MDQNVNLKEHFDQAFRKASGSLRLQDGYKMIRLSLTMDHAEWIQIHDNATINIFQRSYSKSECYTNFTN